MVRKTSGMAKRVWELHNTGFSMSQISDMTKLDKSFVHSTILGYWRDGGVVS